MGLGIFEHRARQIALEVMDAFEAMNQRNREWWWSRTPQERVAMVTVYRRMVWGREYFRPMQRVIEFAEAPWCVAPEAPVGASGSSPAPPTPSGTRTGDLPVAPTGDCRDEGGLDATAATPDATLPED